MNNLSSLNVTLTDTQTKKRTDVLYTALPGRDGSRGMENGDSCHIYDTHGKNEGKHEF